MGTYVDVLLRQAVERKAKTALRFLADGGAAETSVTYAELDARARAIAVVLQRRVTRGERVLVLYPPGVEYVAALFGCLYAGAVPVPAYPPRHARRWSRVVDLAADCGASAAVSNEAIAGQARTAGLAEVCSWISTAAVDLEGGAQWRPPEARDDDVALLQYTSGSTSAPKGVVISHANLLANARAIAEAADAGSDDVLVTWLPPYHDMGLIGCLLQAVYLGQETVAMSPLAFLRSPLRWLQAISRYRGTRSAAPNFAYDLCVRRVTEEQRKTLDLSTWRTAFCGAERVRPETLDRFAAAFEVSGFRRSAFAPCYGLAEATLCVSMAPPDRGLVELPAEGDPSAGPARRLASCGHVVHGTEVRIVDPATRLPILAGTGEVWVRGPQVALGYWNKPDLTAQTFAAEIEGEPGPTYLRTGDLGFLDRGELTIVSRIKDLVILLGRNHYPEDIERTAERADPALRATCGAAFSVDDGGEERLVLVYEIETPVSPAEIEAIAARVRDAVAEEHELRVHTLAIVSSGQVPKTSSGKVQRGLCCEAFLEGKLRERGRSTLATDAVAALPDAARDVAQAEIAAAMASVLEVARVEADESFFALGGHSLLATQLASRLRESLGLELPVRAVFEAPTPALLAARVATLQRVEEPPLTRAPSGSEIVLSHSQERMWFLQQVAPDSSAYNVSGALDLRGDVHVPSLKAALREVVRRHEILRTRFAARGGRPAPSVEPEASWALEVVDLTGHADGADEAMRGAAELARRPFDLARDPVCRAILFCISPDHAVLAMSIHHIAADGWSMSILLRESIATYAAFAAGRPSPLPEPRLQYADYARWQRALLSSRGLEGQEAYWKARLAGLPDFVSFPSDRPRPAEATYEGAMEPMVIPEALSDGIRALAQRSAATPFMVTLAAFNVLLHRYTQQTDLPVGVPIANRNWLASEGLIGTLVNTLVFRSDLSGDPTFAELLERVRETSLSAYGNQDVPFERVVELLQPKRSKGQAPLFQVMFDVQNLDVPTGEVAALRIAPGRVHRRGSQFDLTFSIFNVGAGDLCAVEYATALFDAETIRRMIGHYTTILESAVSDPSLRISRIPMLRDAERQQIERWNATASPYDPSAYVHRQFAARAAERPDAVAITHEGRAVTYGQLARSAGRVAAELERMGVEPGSPVGVCVDRTPSMVASLLGVLAAGAAYVPIDPAYPEARIAMILADAAPRVVVTQRTYALLLTGLGQQAVLVLEDIVAPTGRREAPSAEGAVGVPVHPESPAYILFTSGSTGRPKGVVVPHRALVNFLDSMRRTPGIAPADRLMAITTISFDISGLELYLPLVAGASLELVSREVAADGARLRAALEHVRPTILQATPSTFRMLVDAGYRGSRDLKALCGGEALPHDLAEALLERCGSLWNLYGPTETTIWSTCHPVTSGAGSMPIGRPIANTTIAILDEALEPVPIGVAGEIYIGGDGVALGYWGRADLTAERFVPDPEARRDGAKRYRTGDAARYRSDGTIEYLGRLDGQVKVRGHRIELGEIEAALRLHASVADAAVALSSPRPDDQRLVAYVVARDSRGVAPAELRAHLLARLPEYMVPGIYSALEALPRTPNGKLDRKALPPFAAAAGGDAGGRPPRDGVEAQLAKIWQETLGVRSIAATDDFFALGGHSLLALRLFAKIKADMNVDLPLRVLFEASTIEALAQRMPAKSSAAPVRPTASGRPPSGVAAIQPNGSRAPLFWIDAVGVGGGGGLLRYRRVAELLGQGQPSYGLVEPRQRFVSLVSWAQYCVDAMRSIQPGGPYFLGGYCLGGNLAFEMAHRLRASGEEVAFLALLDSRTQRSCDRAGESRRQYALRLYDSSKRSCRRLAGFDLESQLRMERSALRTLLRATRSRLSGKMVVDDSEFATLMNLGHYSENELDMARHHFRLFMKHEWRPYDGPIDLFRVHRRGFRPRLNALGWELVSNRVAVHVVPGLHEAMLEEPHVHDLARAIRARLDAIHGRDHVSSR